MTTYHHSLSLPSDFQKFRDLAVHDASDEGKDGILILMMTLVLVMARLGGICHPHVVRLGLRSVPFFEHKAGIHHFL